LKETRKEPSAMSLKEQEAKVTLAEKKAAESWQVI